MENLELITRKYLAIWGAGYVEMAPKTVDYTFFNEDNGYEQEDRIKINGLAVGEIANFNSMSGEHFVERIA